MSIEKNTFESEKLELCNENYLHIIHISEITDSIKTLIDQDIVSICEGDSGASLDIIKKRLIKFLKPKINSETEKGAIAEFFMHLYLRSIGFKQEFLYLNLEEESIKKGFDGYYSYDGEEWIYESKSGSSDSIDITHNGKIGNAYHDLKGKISGNTKNNPWQNAYSHASSIDVASAKDLRKNLKKLSEEFTDEKYHNIKDFNIIPSSTIFFEENMETIDSNTLYSNIERLIKNYEFRKINIICLNKGTKRMFWNYLNGKSSCELTKKQPLLT